MRYSAIFLIVLIIVLMIGSIVKCSAQTAFVLDNDGKTYPIIDTVKSELLTSFKTSGDNPIKSTVVITGYKVTKCNYSDKIQSSMPKFEYFYLDRLKVPINNNVTVWMSKPVK